MQGAPLQAGEEESSVTFSWFLHPIKTAFGIWVLGDLLFKFLLDTGIILYFPYTFENL